MATHEEKAEAQADKIARKADDALAGLQIEMAMAKWPAEFRKIMWEAVAETATQRAREVQ
jgi:hypothetical protein